MYYTKNLLSLRGNLDNLRKTCREGE